jgi:hypothetical protein
MLSEIRSGFTTLADGTVAPARASRVGGMVVGDGQGTYYEQTSRGNVFSLVLGLATTTPVAGQLNAAAAAQLTQFCVWNPAGSGKNLSLLKFGVAIVSGTTPAGSVYHSYATAPTNATTVVTPIACNNVGMAAASVARAATHASTGVQLAGNGALSFIRMADLQFSAGTYANLVTTKATEFINGDIVIPPGFMWVPTWTASGTSLNISYSVTWEEIPC